MSVKSGGVQSSKASFDKTYRTQKGGGGGPEDVGSPISPLSPKKDPNQQSNYTGPNKDSYCLLQTSNILAPELLLFSIKNQRLQHIYNEEKDDLEKSFGDIKKVLDVNVYKYEILISFWLCIHLQKLESAKLIYELDPIVEKAVINLRKLGEDLLLEQKKLQEESKKKGMLGLFTKSKQNNQKSGGAGLSSPGAVSRDSSRVKGSVVEDKSSLVSPSVSVKEGAGGENNALDNIMMRMHERNSSMNQIQDNKSGGVFNQIRGGGSALMMQGQDSRMVSSKYSQISGSLKKKSEKNLNNVIEGNQIRKGISNLEDLKELKFLLSKDVGIGFNTNILRIALNFTEEKIASILVAYYQVAIDEDIIIRAIKTGQIDFLYCVFAYNKNFEQISEDEEDMDDDDDDDEDSSDDEFDEEGKKYITFTLDFLFKKTLEFCEDQAINRIRAIVNWKIKSSESVLKSLLMNNLDKVACEYAVYYMHDADMDLMIFALRNNNEVFLKYALKQTIFGSSFLTKEKMIEEFLSILKTGSKTELILNCLNYADFSRWPQKKLRRFIDFIKEIVKSGHEQNRILLCYNNILTISLACEFLEKIGRSISIFGQESKVLVTSLQVLGSKLIDNMEDENVSRTFLDVDFKERTVLKIITQNGFAPLMSNPKVNILLEEIWVGKNTYECDGRIADFSILTFLANAPIKKLKGKKISPIELLSNNFKVSINEEKFWYQYKFRHTSISYIFWKDFLCSGFMLGVFQYINFQYLALFKATNFDNFQGDELIALAQSNIEIYNSFNYYGTLFSGTIFLHLIQKLVFNVFADIKMPIDKWTVIDLIAACFNLVCFNYIGKITPEIVLDRAQKAKIDYYVIVVIVLSWVRFFSYFLVVSSISKLLLTCFKVIQDILTFFFMNMFLLVIGSTFFMVLFQDISAVYYNIFTSFRVLYDALIGQWAWDYINGYPTLHTILFDIHIFLNKIVLTNFLVAILGGSFNEMSARGEFAFQQNQYQFIERYSIAMLDEWGFSEIVIHPPPINFFAMFLIPCIIRKSLMKRTAELFSKLVFWVENILYISIMLIYEFLLIPFIYLRMYYNIIAMSSSFLNTFLLYLLWIPFGIFYLIYCVWKDMFFFFKTLCDYKDEDDIKIEKETEDTKQDKIVIFNEIIEVLRSVMILYKDRKKSKKQKKQNQMTGGQSTQNQKAFQEDDLFTGLGQTPEEEEQVGFAISKQTIIEAWTKFRPTSYQNSPEKGGKSLKQKSKKQLRIERIQRFNQREAQKDYQTLYGEAFITKLMAGMKIKAYNEKLREKQQQIKDQNKLQVNKLVENFTHKLQAQLIAQQHASKPKTIPKEEYDLIDGILVRFILISDGNLNNDLIDLKLALRALPKKVDDNNFYRIPLYNFQIVQKSLIAFQNDDQDELFNYYDFRSKKRLLNLNRKAQFTQKETLDLKQIGSSVLSILNKIIYVGSFVKKDILESNSPRKLKNMVNKMNVKDDLHYQKRRVYKDDESHLIEKKHKKENSTDLNDDAFFLPPLYNNDRLK